MYICVYAHVCERMYGGNETKLITYPSTRFAASYEALSGRNGKQSLVVKKSSLEYLVVVIEIFIRAARISFLFEGIKV